MFPKSDWVRVIAILAYSCSMAQAGTKGIPGAPCPGGPGAACVPQRVTYGYYPTTWRRWPTVGAPKPAPEEVPTPPKSNEPPAKSDDEGPSINAEPTPAQPTDKEPIVTEPMETMPGLIEPGAIPPSESENAPPATPTENAPPATPPDQKTEPGPLQEFIPPNDPLPTEDLLEPPAGNKGATEEKASPSLNGDPFTDEPNQDNDPPPVPPSKSPSSAKRPASYKRPGPSPSSAKKSRQGAVAQNNPAPRWHMTAEAEPAVAREPEVASIDVGQAPARLPVNSTNEEVPLRQLANGADSDRAAMMDTSPSTSNPLRSTSPAARKARVVPAASWSSDSISSDASGVVRRANPLRAN
jgi:hypothetical protein